MNINKIIKEEVAGIINEGFVVKDNRFRFKEVLNNSLFYSYDSFSTDYDLDVTDSNITITWNVSFSLNEMGIENFSIEVESLEGTYNLEYRSKQTDAVEQEIEKNINDNQWKFQIDDTALNLGGSMYVMDLVFDFKNNVCTVGF